MGPGCAGLKQFRPACLDPGASPVIRVAGRKGMRRIDFGRFAVVGLAWAAAGWFSAPAAAQPVPGGAGAEQLQREQRLRELEQLQLDTRLRANEAISPGQRTLVDYGAYLQLNYLSL